MHANVPLESIENSEDADNAHLRAQGHQAALERRFSPLAALGLGFRYVSAIIVCRLVQRVEFQLQAADTREAYSITNSWVGYLSNLGQNLRYDGPRSVVFGLLVATIVQWIITLGLSEVASAFPSAGNGIPFSPFFSVVSPSRDFPVRATILSVGFCCVYGLLYLASTTAFNSIVTGAVLYLLTASFPKTQNITYAIPQGIIATRGRSVALPSSSPSSPRSSDILRLGPYIGYACNILSPLLVIVFGVCICFPPQLPVTVGNMNYTAVILAGLWVMILGFWYARRGRFEGPRIDWKGLGVEGCE
ncbi:MAG: hypothetical protein OHK93_003890 [Ramalina farinacea]|uniref:Uncharacterized protein n=1 Tax=Ramalina farinacea TaxID=258253 RepID=A0AA43TNP9_9LECA|nr:hypothetical protein [Ramalina farinacea]